MYPNIFLAEDLTSIPDISWYLNPSRRFIWCGIVDKKRVIRSRKSKKDKQCNYQQGDKRRNKDLQNTKQKTKDRTKDITLGIQPLAWDRHKYVAVLHWLMGFQSSPLAWIYINIVFVSYYSKLQQQNSDCTSDRFWQASVAGLYLRRNLTLVSDFNMICVAN